MPNFCKTVALAFIAAACLIGAADPAAAQPPGIAPPAGGPPIVLAQVPDDRNFLQRLFGAEPRQPRRPG
ncbi:hypothetical protein, partial [Methylobrevis pamukkalensis]|uniref:hypothetical protein n=1 Tax=Methylobrevis pamukkalensis TaxID=1439726 RepID=UPI00114D28E7